MFISIVRDPQVGDALRHNSLYECDRYHITQERPGELLITMEGRGAAQLASYLTTENNLGIYVMNNLGRTIDTIFRSPN